MLISVTRIEAAQSQLRTAIEMFFTERDPVSIHTLATSAYQIIHDLNHERKGEPLLYDSDLIKDECRKQFVGLAKDHGNFFKHADKRRKRSSGDKVLFNPRQSEFFMLFAIKGVRQLGVRTSDVEEAFTYWVCIHQPQLLVADFRKALTEQVPVKSLQELRAMDREQFFEGFMPAMAHRRTKA
jgi:hypothetical protein